MGTRPRAQGRNAAYTPRSVSFGTQGRSRALGYQLSFQTRFFCSRTREGPMSAGMHSFLLPAAQPARRSPNLPLGGKRPRHTAAALGFLNARNRIAAEAPVSFFSRVRAILFLPLGFSK